MGTGITRIVMAALLLAPVVFAQTLAQPASQTPGAPGPGQPPLPLPPGQTNDPFPGPIAASEDVIPVNVAEFASLPDIDGVAARMMNLVDEPGTKRLFVNDMRGPLYSVSYDGKTVTLYLDVNAPRGPPCSRPDGSVAFRASPSTRSSGSQARPALASSTCLDTTNMTPRPTSCRLAGTSPPTTPCCSVDGQDAGRGHLRWRCAARAVPPAAAFANHNAGHMAFATLLASPGSPEFGLLYVGVADGGAAAIRSTWRRTSDRLLASCFASIRSATTAATSSTASPRAIRS
jgi:hypothetical protein